MTLSSLFYSLAKDENLSKSSCTTTLLFPPSIITLISFFIFKHFGFQCSKREEDNTLFCQLLPFLFCCILEACSLKAKVKKSSFLFPCIPTCELNP